MFRNATSIKLNCILKKTFNQRLVSQNESTTIAESLESSFLGANVTGAGQTCTIHTHSYLSCTVQSREFLTTAFYTQTMLILQR